MDNRELCLRYLMGEATEQEVAALNDWIAQSPANAQRFALLAAQESSMAAAVGNICAPTEPDVMSEVIDQALALRRQHEVEDEANRQLAAQQAEDARNRRFELRRHAQPQPVKRVIVIPQVLVWLGVAAVLGVAATVIYQFGRPAPQATTPPITEQAPARQRQPLQQVAPDPAPAPAPAPTPVLATLVRTLDARWVDATGMWDGRLGLREGRHTLARGLVEIELAEGTRVVLQAPVSFELTGANAMSLSTGRLVANVPPSGYGFTVDTPTARIIDYGTEFGVDSDANGATQVHVFQGEVRAARRVDGQVVGDSVALGESQSAAIDAGGASIARVDFAGQTFERRVAKRLDLADIIVGGDGTTGYRDIGLHPATGRYIRNITGDASLIGLISDNRAHDVPGTPLVARVFIPGTTGQIDALPAGLTLPGLPQTNGVGYGVIWCGHEMPSLNEDQYFPIRSTLAGHDFTGPGQQTVIMHTNVGLVLDLDALRKEHPGFEVAALLGVVGNSSKPVQPGDPNDFRSEFLLFLDDDPAAHHVFVRSDPDAQRSARLDIDIPAGTRYVTLVSADGGDGNHQDWVVLGDPTLVLEPIEEH